MITPELLSTAVVLHQRNVRILFAFLLFAFAAAALYQYQRSGKKPLPLYLGILFFLYGVGLSVYQVYFDTSIAYLEFFARLLIDAAYLSALLGLSRTWGGFIEKYYIVPIVGIAAIPLEFLGVFAGHGVAGIFAGNYMSFPSDVIFAGAFFIAAYYFLWYGHSFPRQGQEAFILGFALVGILRLIRQFLVAANLITVFLYFNIAGVLLIFLATIACFPPKQGLPLLRSGSRKS